MYLGNAKGLRDLSLLIVVTLMRWQTGSMLGLLDWSWVMSVGRGGGCSFGDFHTQNPPTFNGEPDLMVVENRLLKMEKLLSALECADA